MKRLMVTAMIMMIVTGAAFARGRAEGAYGNGQPGVTPGAGRQVEAVEGDKTVARSPGRRAQGFGDESSDTWERGTGRAGESRGVGSGTGSAAAEYAGSVHEMIADTEPADLTGSEAEGLIFMREEEKLARDVYQALYEVWNYPIFANIARSEQQHTDSMLVLIDRYGLEDPVTEDVRGVFESETLQTLYDKLVEQGKQSLVDALTVGATIEDLDMADLLSHIDGTDNEDIALVYQNLLKGSRNHMRSFAALLERQGVEYEAQHVSAGYLATVLSSDREIAAITDPNHAFSDR